MFAFGYEENFPGVCREIMCRSMVKAASRQDKDKTGGCAGFFPDFAVPAAR
mgnify:CR=1 FL=1